MAFVVNKTDLGTTLGKMSDGKKVGMDLWTIEDILDNGMLISRVIMNSNFNLTMAYGMKDMFVTEENGMWRIKM